MTLKNIIHAKMMDTLPYSAFGNKSVYKGTSRKLNILGKTVASPYIAVCLKRFLYKLKIIACFSI